MNPQSNELAKQAHLTIQQSWVYFIQKKRREGLELLKTFKQDFSSISSNNSEQIKEIMQLITIAKKYHFFLNIIFPLPSSPEVADNPTLFDELCKIRGKGHLHLILKKEIRTFLINKLQNPNRQESIKSKINTLSRSNNDAGKNMERIIANIFAAINLNPLIRAKILPTKELKVSKMVILSPHSKNKTALSLTPRSSTQKDPHCEEKEIKKLLPTSNNQDSSQKTEPLAHATHLPSTKAQAWSLFKEAKGEEAEKLLINYLIETEKSSQPNFQKILIEINSTKICLTFLNMIFPFPCAEIPSLSECSQILRKHSFEIKTMWNLRYTLSVLFSDELSKFFLSLLQDANRQKFIKKLLNAPVGGLKLKLKQFMSRFCENIGLEPNLRDSLFLNQNSSDEIQEPDPSPPILEADFEYLNKPFREEFNNPQQEPSLSVPSISESKRDNSAKSYPYPSDEIQEPDPSTPILEADFEYLNNLFIEDSNSLQQEPSLTVPLMSESKRDDSAQFYPYPSDLFDYESFHQAGLDLKILIDLKYEEAWLLFSMGKKDAALSLLEFFLNSYSFNEELSAQIKAKITCFQFLKYCPEDLILPQSIISEFQGKKESLKKNEQTSSLNPQASEFIPTNPERFDLRAPEASLQNSVEENSHFNEQYFHEQVSLDTLENGNLVINDDHSSLQDLKVLMDLRFKQAWHCFKIGKEEAAISLLKRFLESYVFDEKMESQIKTSIECFQFLKELFQKEKLKTKAPKVETSEFLLSNYDSLESAPSGSSLWPAVSPNCPFNRPTPKTSLRYKRNENRSSLALSSQATNLYAFWPNTLRIKANNPSLDFNPTKENSIKLNNNSQ